MSSDAQARHQVLGGSAVRSIGISANATPAATFKADAKVRGGPDAQGAGRRMQVVASRADPDGAIS